MRTYGLDDMIEGFLGACFLIYAYFGFGKTHSLGTLPDPIGLINSEPRDPRRVLSWVKGKKKIKFFEPETFDEYMELIFQMEEKAKKGVLPFKSVAIDNLSFSQSNFKMTLEDDRYEYRIDKNQARGGLLDRLRIDEQDWQPMGSAMKRLTKVINNLSKYGIIVVCTAWVVENPRWNRILSAAPSFQGRDYSLNMNGYFDFIGFVEEPWKMREDGTIRPPIVSFTSDGDYVAKSTSPALTKKGRGPLDFKKILQLIQGNSSLTSSIEVEEGR